MPTMNESTFKTSKTAIPTPIPPAGSIGGSVRALNKILDRLSGDEAIEALKTRQLDKLVDGDAFAPAWEGARNFRDQFIISLARHTREEWRADVAVYVRSQGIDTSELIATALQQRLTITLFFAFKYLTPRHVCLLGDVLMLAFESEIKPTEFAREIAESANSTPGVTNTFLEALLLGSSGMHRFQPERVLALM
jgi:hypothetical protein